MRARSKRTRGRACLTPRVDGPRSCSSHAASFPRSRASAVRNTTVPPGQSAGSLGQGPPPRRAAHAAIQVGRVHARVCAGLRHLGEVGSSSDLGVRIVSGLDRDPLPVCAVDAEHRIANDLPIRGPQHLSWAVRQALGGGPGPEEPDASGVHRTGAEPVVHLPFLG
jgi:hypothetical protein